MSSLIMAGALLAAQWTASGTTNYLQNPGFEQELQAWASTGTAAAIFRTEWHPRKGDWAFGIGNDEGTDDSYGQLSQEIDLAEPLSETKVCRFMVWVKAEGRYGGEVVLKQEFIDANGGILWENERRFSGVSKQRWEVLSIWMRAPVNTKSIRVSCISRRIKSGKGDSFVWFDDAALVLE